MEKVMLGSHVSMNAPKFFLGSVEEALSYNEDTFMFYTGAPQNSYRKPLNELKIEEGLALLKEHNIDPNKLIVHAPYIVNPANFSRPDLYQLSFDVLKNEVIRTYAFGAKTLVLHPGSAVGQDREDCLKAIASLLDKIFDEVPNDVKIALETMAGKGSELGVNFLEIKKIIDYSKHPERLGVCLDTCHISDSGYNIFDVNAILKEFDEVIGLNNLLVIHLNDSKNPQGAHKDRHENIGYGEIGFDALNKVVHHPLLINVPKILETPYINEKPPYKKEIEMLRNGVYEQNWRDNF